MSQEYEPVTWQDETTSQQGTLINAERLNTMQTAHHYADGWEEVDAVPSGDPGVDYHKVVYCTADSTFYRWDGSAWTKDIDDVTKAELDAEIERATLAEGALDSAKADKATTLAGYGITDAYTKAQTDTLLAGKMDDGDAYTKAETDTLLAGKADKASTLAGYGITDAYTKSEVNTKLTDGSVTKVGTSNVGGDNIPIKLVAGVPTAVTYALVDTATAQTVDGVKTFTSSILQRGSASPTIRPGNDPKTTTPVSALTHNMVLVQDDASNNLNGIFSTTGTDGKRTITAYSFDCDGTYRSARLLGPTVYADAISSDVVTLALLDNYPTMVRTANNQTIEGLKTFYSSGFSEVAIKSGRASGNLGGLAFYDSDGTQVGRVYAKLNGSIDLEVSTGNKAVTATKQRAYNTSNTDDVVTIGTLKASTDVVHTSGAESIEGLKTFGASSRDPPIEIKSLTYAQDYTAQAWWKGTRYTDRNNYEMGDINLYQNDTIRAIELVVRNKANTSRYDAFRVCSPHDGSAAFMTGLSRAYNASNTAVVATIGTLDGYSPMVRTSGNQDIAGVKTFTSPPVVLAPKTAGFSLTTGYYKIAKFGVSPRWYAIGLLATRGASTAIASVTGSLNGGVWTTSTVSQAIGGTPERLKIGVCTLDGENYLVAHITSSTALNILILGSTSGSSTVLDSMSVVTPESITPGADYVEGDYVI